MNSTVTIEVLSARSGSLVDADATADVVTLVPFGEPSELTDIFTLKDEFTPRAAEAEQVNLLGPVVNLLGPGPE